MSFIYVYFCILRIDLLNSSTYSRNIHFSNLICLKAALSVDMEL